MALDLSFKELADTATQGGGSNGQPLKIPLAQIDEDPDQPRRVFSEAELIELAETIRLVGVLQPIIVRPSEVSGRYVIRMGARRYRAAKLAALDAIPAIIGDATDTDRYAQMIENIQRDDLAVTDIAAFIAARLDAGDKQADIARKLSKSRDWVSRYAAIPRMPDCLKAKLDTSSIRAVYELYQAWREQPEAIELECSTHDSFTDADARAIAREVRGPTHPPATPIPANELQIAPSEVEKGEMPEAAEPVLSDRSHISENPAIPRETRRNARGVSIMVRHNERSGRLMIDQAAGGGTRFAVVQFSEADRIEELAVSELRIEEIVLS